MQLQNIKRDRESDYFVPYLFRRFQSGDVTRIYPSPLCYYAVSFGQTRNGSVAPHLILCTSTALSSATDDYVAVPERLVPNDEPASRNKEHTWNKPSSAPKM